MSQPAQLSARAAVALGLVLIAAGLSIILVAWGIVPGAPPSLEAPRWVVACVGLAFALCGGAVIIGFAVTGAARDGDLRPGTPWWIRVTQYLLGLGVVSCMAAIFSWIAFGPGERMFTVTGPFLGRGPASESVGRSVFGVGAALMYVFLAVLAVVAIRRLRRRK